MKRISGLAWLGVLALVSTVTSGLWMALARFAGATWKLAGLVFVVAWGLTMVVLMGCALSSAISGVRNG